MLFRTFVLGSRGLVVVVELRQRGGRGLVRLDDHRDHRHLLPCGLRAPCVTGSVDHLVERLVAGRPEPRRHVGRDHGGHSPHPPVGLGRVHDVAAGSTDPQHADPLGVDVRTGRQVRHRVAEVVGALDGVLEAVRRALALTLVGRVEGQRQEALVGETLCVQTRGLLLHTGRRMPDDDGGERSVARTFGRVGVSGEHQAVAGKADIGLHGKVTSG
jgi:hypothetical protein